MTKNAFGREKLFCLLIGEVSYSRVCYKRSRLYNAFTSSKTRTHTKDTPEFVHKNRGPSRRKICTLVTVDTISTHTHTHTHTHMRIDELIRAADRVLRDTVGGTGLSERLKH